MTTKIEQVARAIDNIFNSEGRVFDGTQATDLARVAIEAMREPTEGMKEAYRQYASQTDKEGLHTSFTYGYAVMIDAALKEG